MIKHNLPAAEYFAINARSQSEVKKFLPPNGCPALYQWAKQNPSPPTQRMQIGTLSHSAGLQADTLADEVAVLDAETQDRLLYDARAAGSKATEFSKRLATYKQWEAEQGNKLIVTPEEMANARQVAEVVASTEEGRAMQAGEIEMSIINDYEAEHGIVAIKGRLDSYDESTGTVYDLKTTQDPSPYGFGSSAHKFGYHFQSGWYRMLLEAEGKRFERFVLFAIQPEPPFLFGIWEVEPKVSRWAQHMAESVLERIAECEKTGIWPAYGCGYLELPGYVQKQISEDLETMPDLPDPF